MAYDDEIILDSFKRNNKTNQTSKNKNIENLKVREENVKKATKKNKKNKNPRLTLKRVATATLAALVLSGSGAIATKIYRDVKVPVGFDYSGTSISSTRSLPDEINDDFVLIEVNSWKKGISEKSIENIKKCNEKGVPCGILLNSDATSEKEATADAACILALTEDDKIECPIYYNIDGIVGKVPDEKLIEICTAFYEMCRGASVGIGAKEDTLDKIKEDLPNELKLMAISDGKEIKTLTYQKQKEIVSKETSETMKMLLESVVSEGSGHNAYLEGYRIGGKTATSQTLPRSANKYISSFVGFAPANDPKVIGMVIIYDPKGIYYGGTIAAPVLRDIYDNVLPYLEKQEK